tara:strand:- start:5739 stop:6092 length:354 start_codon:yes stop_codon:yes gene_type:complete
MEKKVYLEIQSKEQFHEILKENPNYIIIKFTATWCKPCQRIKNQVNRFFLNSPRSVLCFDLDVDDNFEIYNYFKKNRRLNGIPALFLYKKGNTNLIADESITGASSKALENFFSKVI